MIFSRPCRFHHTGAHSCSYRGAERPRNSVVLSVYYFYFMISLATQWFIFHGLQVLWNKNWEAFSPKLCQTQNVEKIWMLNGKGHRLVLDGHTRGGDVSESLTLSDFTVPNILPKHTFKAKADIENWFYIAPYFFFFFTSFSPTDFPYLPLLHVFTTAWHPSSWHIRVSWLLNIIMLSRACWPEHAAICECHRYEEWYKNYIFGSMFQFVFWHKVTEKCNLRIDGQLVCSKLVM